MSLSAIAANYPHTLTAVAKKQGGNYWATTQNAIDHIKLKDKYDLKASDNKYHCAVKYEKEHPLSIPRMR